jgi:hypothetical protein
MISARTGLSEKFCRKYTARPLSADLTCELFFGDIATSMDVVTGSRIPLSGIHVESVAGRSQSGGSQF